MAQLSQSREASKTIRTLADVLVSLKQRDDLPERQRADFASAVRSTGKVLGRPLAEIPAEVKLLSRRLDKINPTEHGFKKQSWVNVKSRLRKALASVGVEVREGRSTKPLNEDWQRLRELLPAKPLGAGLSNFMAYCTRCNILPDQVSDQTLKDYYADLCEFGLLRREKSAYRKACICWNKAAASLPDDWPQIQVEVPCFKDEYTLPWDELPISLRLDVNEMIASCTGQDLLSDRHVRLIKPSSANARGYQIRRLASAAIHHGIDANRMTSIRAVLAIDVVKAGLRFLLDRSGNNPTKSIHALMRTVSCLAKEWAETGEDQLAEIDRLKKSLNPGNLHQMTDKNRDLVHRFEDIELLRRLIALPDRAINKVADQGHITATMAVRAQAALAIQVLTMAPMRLKNLASIDLEKHLVKLGSGRVKQMHIHFAEDEVKNSRSLSYPIPKQLAASIETYCEKIRPVLLRADNNFLFPGEGDRHKAPGLLSRQIASLTASELGVRITPHQFRHIAGAIILRQNPQAHEHVRQLLGHGDIATTIAYYAPLAQDRAVQLYDNVILGLAENEEDAA